MFKSFFGKHYLLNCGLNSPLFAIYILFPFILLKDLHATPFQITVLISLKPLAAIPAAYWSTLKWNPKTSFLWAMVIGIAPTLLFPFYNNVWWFVVAFGFFHFAERAIIPIWMEILKSSLSNDYLSKNVSWGSLISFIASSIVPVMLSSYLDISDSAWKWMFCFFALISLLRVPFAYMLSIKNSHKKEEEQTKIWSRPWKRCYQLLCRRKDFALYQLIFLFGGLGLMVTQPALPQFVTQVLGLTYTELALAIALCKGIGFMMMNPFWSNWIQKIDIYFFSAIVSIVAAFSLFLVLISSSFHMAIYLSSFTYGVMQAGSQLSWQLAGPIFSKSEDSHTYTTTNVMMVGLRGCVGPYLGGAVCAFFGLQAAYLVGIGFCLFGGGIGLLVSRFESKKMITAI